MMEDKLERRKKIEHDVLGYNARRGDLILSKNSRHTKYVTPSAKSCEYNELSEIIHNSELNISRDEVESNLFWYLEEQFKIHVVHWKIDMEGFVKHWLRGDATLDSYNRYDAICNLIEQLNLYSKDEADINRELNIIKFNVHNTEKKYIKAKVNRVRRLILKHLKPYEVTYSETPQWIKDAMNEQYQFQRINSIAHYFKYHRKEFNEEQTKYINKQLNKWDYESSKMHYKIPQEVKNKSRRNSRRLDIISSKRELACSSKDPEELHKLAKDKNECVRRSVACNYYTSPKTLKYLSSDEDYWVRCYVAQNGNTPIEVLENMALDENISVRMCITKNINITIGLVRILSRDDNHHVATAVQELLKERKDFSEEFTVEEHKHIEDTINSIFND